jgi:ribonuclease HII
METTSIEETPKIKKPKTVKPKPPKKEKPLFKSNPTPLLPNHSDESSFEIGIDEAGRGPLFGRVYVAAVVLPKDSANFHHEWMRDSKKIKSKKTMTDLANYIKQHALYWDIQYAEAAEIDQSNILVSVINGMHRCVQSIVAKLSIETDKSAGLLLVDGNYFKPYVKYDEASDQFISLQHQTVEKGDGTYSSIAAASILAKDARDTYVEELCKAHPDLSSRYALEKNMGYGTKAHIDGIKSHGITQWHRKTFNICRGEKENIVL